MILKDVLGCRSPEQKIAAVSLSFKAPPLAQFLDLFKIQITCSVVVVVAVVVIVVVVVVVVSLT